MGDGLNWWFGGRELSRGQVLPVDLEEGEGETLEIVSNSDGFYRQPRVVPQRMRSDKEMPRVSACGVPGGLFYGYYY